MEDCFIFVDNGFFKLVKKEFEEHSCAWQIVEKEGAENIIKQFHKTIK